VRVLPLSNIPVGDQILAMRRLVEFVEHLAGIDEGLEPGSLDELLFVALPTRAVNEVVIEGSVFVRMLQVQAACQRRFENRVNQPV